MRKKQLITKQVAKNNFKLAIAYKKPYFSMLLFALYFLVINALFITHKSLAHASLTHTSTTQINIQEENKLQVVYLYNFLKFIQWPQNKTLSDSQSYQICIIGNDPFGAMLDLFKTKKINNKSIQISYLSSIKNIQQCHVAFISTLTDKDYAAIMKMPKNTGLLTVSADTNFALRGGVIGFLMHNNKLRFNINRTIAKKYGLEINSKLLELAITVY